MSDSFKNKVKQQVKERLEQGRRKWQEGKQEREKLRRESDIARTEEKLRLARERGKHEARRGHARYSRPHKSVREAAEYAARTPQLEAVGDPLNFFAPSNRPKPKKETTTIHAGNKTIRITSHGEERKKKKSARWTYYDPFLDF